MCICLNRRRLSSKQNYGYLSKLIQQNISSSERNQLIKTINRLLQQQSLLNPHWYVDHGETHSIRVAELSITLSRLIEIQQAFKRAYQSNSIQSEFLAGITGLLHDVGYGHDSFKDPSTPKARHSLIGRIILHNNSDVFISAFKHVFGKEKAALLFRELKDNVGNHNANKGGCLLTHSKLEPENWRSFPPKKKNH